MPALKLPTHQMCRPIEEVQPWWKDEWGLEWISWGMDHSIMAQFCTVSF